ncbi:hypothetical protein D1007_28051 [Hordeum vulgare]|nr:hypothetical protein D1007_28051 [Hordeum vulgare]
MKLPPCWASFVLGPAGYDPDGKGPVPRFTSTAKFGARIPDDEWDDFDYSAWDCRHGRVLLGDTHNTALLVWDPMTGCRRGLDWPNLLDDSHGFAVLCAVSGCRHRTCHAALPAAPIKDSEIGTSSIIMAMEDGSLGYAHVNGSTLYLWSRLMDSNRVDSWSKRTIINLGNLLPIQNPVEKIRLVGSVEGGDVVFVTTVLGIYEINVESQRWKKLWKRINFDALIPYMSFYNRQAAAVTMVNYVVIVMNYVTVE